MRRNPQTYRTNWGAVREERICRQCRVGFVAERRDIDFCTDRCGLLHRYHRATGQERRHLARRLGGLRVIAAARGVGRAA